MSDKKEDIIGAGTLLRGNFSPKSANSPDIAVEHNEKSAEVRSIEEFENAARERIGGSIAFVTRLKNKNSDPLVWDGDDND